MINSIDDERIAFYLKHQELIETWADVRGDVVGEANQFYSRSPKISKRGPLISGVM